MNFKQYVYVLIDRFYDAIERRKKKKIKNTREIQLKIFYLLFQMMRISTTRKLNEANVGDNSCSNIIRRE